MVKPVLICVPRQMAYYQLGAPGAGRHTGILLGTGRNSFDCWFPTGLYTGYVPSVLLDRAISKPVLSDPGILVAAGVHFDMSGLVLYPGGDSLRACPHLLV